jgi:signal transduction histidine kinase
VSVAASLSIRRPARWPWLVVALFVVLGAVGSVLIVANGRSLAGDLPFFLAFGMFGVVGALIVSRAPDNRIGGLLLYGAGSTVVAAFSGELTTYLVNKGITGPVAVVCALLGNVTWSIGILPVMLLLPLVFPDGHLPSPRWRVVAAAVLTLAGLFTLGTLFGTDRLTGSLERAGVGNPLFIPAVADAYDALDAVGDWFFLPILAASGASLVVRFRRARGVERQQIKWVALAVAYVVVALVISEILLALDVSTLIADGVVVGSAFLSIPVSIGVATLQYRLYDLDVVVKKTVVAGTVALVVIGVYAAIVGFFGVVTAGGESSATVFVIALLLGVAFRPVTRFARRLADRLVYGTRATPYEVLTEFSERVGDAYATEDVLGRMARILGEGVGAQSARVWLHVGNELRPASAWPSDLPTPAPAGLTGESLPNVEGETAVEVRDKGELLGALSVSMPPNDPMTPAKERLVRDLASQAGLVLRNVRLIEDLRASQRRIVAAQDAERRRLERNIHDGAQQQLVALSVKLRLAESLVAKEPAKAEAMLADLRDETQRALEDLRDLARGIYPPLLADKGLAAALEAQARKSPLPVEVSPDGVGRYSQEIEAAVYFSVLEALQNVAKYAGASHTSVELDENDGWLTFKVVDDGSGFDPSVATDGSGLQGIVDRLSALGGNVQVRSGIGEGTTIAGRIPVGSGATATT